MNSSMGRSQSQEVTLIVGAGITGLTTAYLLSREGVRCVVLEKSRDIGGLCRTFKMDDILFDLGPHFFFFNKDFEADRLMMSLLKGEDIIKRKFRFSIRYKGKDWKFPIDIIDAILYPAEHKLRLLSRLLTKRKDTGDSISVKDDVVDKLGITYYEEAIGPMLRHKTFLSGQEIHRDWVARVDRNIHNANEPFMPISLTKHLWLTIRRVLWSETYLYPAEGYGVFAQNLWKRFSQLGGQTILDCGDITFENDNNRISKVVVMGKELSTRDVIWTGSVNDLNYIIGSNAPKIKYLKAVIVLLSYDQKKRIDRPFGYIYYPDMNLIFNRLYYPSSIFGRQSPADREGICFELNYVEELETLTDRELIERVVRDAGKVGLFEKEQLRQSQVVRLGECLPVYSLGYENEIRATFGDVHRFRNLYSVGRLGGYYSCLTPMAVSQGIKMAGHLLQNKRDL